MQLGLLFVLSLFFLFCFFMSVFVGCILLEVNQVNPFKSPAGSGTLLVNKEKCPKAEAGPLAGV